MCNVTLNCEFKFKITAANYKKELFCCIEMDRSFQKDYDKFLYSVRQLLAWTIVSQFILLCMHQTLVIKIIISKLVWKQIFFKWKLRYNISCHLKNFMLCLLYPFWEECIYNVLYLCHVIHTSHGTKGNSLLKNCLFST